MIRALQIVLLCAFLVYATAFARPCNLSGRKRILMDVRAGCSGPISSLLADNDKKVDIEGESMGTNIAGSVEDTFAGPSPSVKRKSPWWSLTRIFDATERFFSNFLNLFVTDPDILFLLSRGISAAFWVFFALSVLGTVGFDTKPLLSLLSVAGFTFGFAAKDMIASTFSGLVMLFLRPFERDMVISVAGHRGRVVSMDVRFLKLEGLDKSTILIPLSKVYGDSIVIESAKGHRH
ncbi:mechanosensitive ion channel [archaeon]|nr:MAG: mechanosensitive ion channel [archaeon]